MFEKTNFAARAGRWSAAHWKTAFLGWFVLCVATVTVLGAWTMKTPRLRALRST